MNPSFTIGRVAGVRVGVNWSWLVVLALIVWTLGSAVFPAQNPGLSHGTYYAMAVAAALLFFVSLFLHELGHALQARRDGVEIEGITLWLFGGVARLKGAFPSAGAEFRIAVAGPLVSLAIGAVFVAVAAGLPLPEALDGAAAWLGYINLILLVFNLLPALPLDGGRVLHAALWASRGDFHWATVVGASIGRAFGYVMIAGGLALLVFQGTLSGIWLALIGWFLLGAAAGEVGAMAAREALAGLRVGDLMVRAPVTARSGQTLGEFMDEVAWSGRHTVYPVVDDGHAIGLLHFRDVVGVPRAEWDERTVRECMSPVETVPVVGEDESAYEALEQLSESELHRALVLEDGRLVGFLSASDIARALQPRGRQPG